MNDEENVFLRVTKLSTSGSNSFLSSTNHHHQSIKKFQSSLRETWDDSTGRLLNDNTTKNNRTRKHSLSDDYVFL